MLVEQIIGTHSLKDDFAMCHCGECPSLWFMLPAA